MRVMGNESMIVEAARLADYAHSGQKRKWNNAHKDYIVHPLRVAGMVTIYKGATEEMVAAAWLHDTVEDTSITIEDIISRFGEEVASLVMGLTNPSKGMDASREERKRIDREHLARQSNEVKLIKLCDRIDNLRDLEDSGAPQDFIRKYRAESLLLLDEALSGVDDGLEAEVRRLAE